MNQDRGDCPRCGGTGYMPQYNHVEGGVCFRCRGTGFSRTVIPSSSPTSFRSKIRPLANNSTANSTLSTENTSSFSISPSNASPSNASPSDASPSDASPEVSLEHIFQNEVCVKCGCSKGAIEHFSWKCKPHEQNNTNSSKKPSKAVVQVTQQRNSTHVAPLQTIKSPKNNKHLPTGDLVKAGSDIVSPVRFWEWLISQPGNRPFKPCEYEGGFLLLFLKEIWGIECSSILGTDVFVSTDGYEFVIPEWFERYDGMFVHNLWYLSDGYVTAQLAVEVFASIAGIETPQLPIEDKEDGKKIECSKCKGSGSCKSCRGSGRIDGGKTRCYVCNGSGACQVCYGDGSLTV